MTIKEAIKVLRHFNEWRRYDGEPTASPKMPSPKKVGEAIDVVCAALEEAPKAHDSKPLTWKDIRTILDIEYSMFRRHSRTELVENGEEAFYTEILDKFNDEQN